jgi:hypothetical protein
MVYASLRLHTAACYESSNDCSNNSHLSRPLMEEESSLPQSPSSEDTSSRQAFRPSSACLYGALAGFLMQTIAVGACIAMAFEFGEDAPSSRSCLYLLLKLLSRIDICLSVIVWATFTMSLTQRGMRLLKSQQCFEFESKRSIFDIGVNSILGTVLGSLAASTVINIILGFPSTTIPFLPLVGTVCGDVVICYLMVVCYDWYEADGDNLKEETVEDGVSCC